LLAAIATLPSQAKNTLQLWAFVPASARQARKTIVDRIDLMARPDHFIDRRKQAHSTVTPSCREANAMDKPGRRCLGHIDRPQSLIRVGVSDRRTQILVADAVMERFISIVHIRDKYRCAL
jgi:hypothetical protein